MKKPECDTFLDSILDDEVPTKDLAEHLSTCSACHSLRQEATRIKSGPSPTASLQPSPSFLTRLEHHVASVPSSRPGISLGGKVLLAAATVFCLSTSAFVLWPRLDSSTNKPGKPGSVSQKEVANPETNSLASSEEIRHESKPPAAASTSFSTEAGVEPRPVVSSSPASGSFPALKLPSPNDDVEE